MDALSPNTVHEQRVSRVALLIGRPLYWRTGPTDAVEHAGSVHRMLQWCLGMPGARLGVLSPKEKVLWDWLEGEDAKNWGESALNALEGFARQLDRLPSESLLLPEFNRFRCMVFAPIRCRQFPCGLRKPFRPKSTGMPSNKDRAGGHRTFRSSPLLVPTSTRFFRKSGRLDLHAFARLMEQLAHGRAWAPSPPNDLGPVKDLALEEALSLLEEVLWKSLETSRIPSFLIDFEIAWIGELARGRFTN